MFSFSEMPCYRSFNATDTQFTLLFALKSFDIWLIQTYEISVLVKKRSSTSHDRETAERLLDTAERLFGELGYDAVGMRALASAAHVNLGAATYHFGSKKELYIETFLRRFRPTNVECIQLLREAEEGEKTLTVEKIVDCMIRPPFMLGLKHPYFHRLMSRSIFTPLPFLNEAIEKESDSSEELFVRALCRVLPDIPEDLIRLRVMLGKGALLTHNFEMRRGLPDCNPRLDEKVLSEIIRFVSAGLQSGMASSLPFPKLSEIQK